ncbi:uncharacterized protein LOC135168842 [Diachasmimorpha longicaudata]|uniref:uncharacterized protein LOC135168842 n=1 Tax=Diachasmimorpha longicaudata TaxID=58733 RepID=UPI0030B87023
MPHVGLRDGGSGGGGIRRRTPIHGVVRRVERVGSPLLRVRSSSTPPSKGVCGEHPLSAVTEPRSELPGSAKTGRPLPETAFNVPTYPAWCRGEPLPLILFTFQQATMAGLKCNSIPEAKRPPIESPRGGGTIMSPSCGEVCASPPSVPEQLQLQRLQ